MLNTIRSILGLQNVQSSETTTANEGETTSNEGGTTSNAIVDSYETINRPAILKQKANTEQAEYINKAFKQHWSTRIDRISGQVNNQELSAFVDLPAMGADLLTQIDNFYPQERNDICVVDFLINKQRVLLEEEARIRKVIRDVKGSTTDAQANRDPRIQLIQIKTQQVKKHIEIVNKFKNTVDHGWTLYPLFAQENSQEGHVLALEKGTTQFLRLSVAFKVNLDLSEVPSQNNQAKKVARSNYLESWKRLEKAAAEADLAFFDDIKDIMGDYAADFKLTDKFTNRWNKLYTKTASKDKKLAPRREALETYKSWAEEAAAKGDKKNMNESIKLALHEERALQAISSAIKVKRDKSKWKQWVGSVNDTLQANFNKKRRKH